MLRKKDLGWDCPWCPGSSDESRCRQVLPHLTDVGISLKQELELGRKWKLDLECYYPNPLHAFHMALIYTRLNYSYATYFVSLPEKNKVCLLEEFEGMTDRNLRYFFFF